MEAACQAPAERMVAMLRRRLYDRRQGALDGLLPLASSCMAARRCTSSRLCRTHRRELIEPTMDWLRVGFEFGFFGMFFMGLPYLMGCA